MSAADSARKRADAVSQELMRDAVSIRLSLERIIRDLAENGTCSGTYQVAQAAADLDRRMQYLRGLREGLDMGEAR